MNEPKVWTKIQNLYVRLDLQKLSNISLSVMNENQQRNERSLIRKEKRRNRKLKNDWRLYETLSKGPNSLLNRYPKENLLDEVILRPNQFLDNELI